MKTINCFFRYISIELSCIDLIGSLTFAVLQKLRLPNAQMLYVTLQRKRRFLKLFDVKFQVHSVLEIGRQRLEKYSFSYGTTHRWSLNVVLLFFCLLVSIKNALSLAFIRPCFVRKYLFTIFFSK